MLPPAHPLAACLAAAAVLSLAAPARAEADGAGPRRWKVALLGRSPHAARGETERIQELFQGELEATNQLAVMKPAALDDALRGRLQLCGDDFGCAAGVWKEAGADLVAWLDISRSGGQTSLALAALKTESGAVLLRARQAVAAGKSLVAAVETLARQLAAAASGEAVPAMPEADLPESFADPSRRPLPEPPEGRPAEEPSPAPEVGYEPKALALVGGLEFGGGPWSANPAGIINGAKTGFDFSQYAPAFTAPLNGQWRAAMNLHLGWSFLGHGAVEAAFQSSAWGAGGPSPGGAALAGIRATWFPLQLFLPERRFDAGLEIGGGYAIVGGPFYDMDGSYFTVGITGEYYLTPWLGVQAFYRLFTPFLSRFFLDYASGRSEPVQNFTALWNTLGVGAVVHFTLLK